MNTHTAPYIYTRPYPSSLAVSVVLQTVQMTTGQTSSSATTMSSNNADSPGHEFVSDTMRVSDTDLEEVREGMKKLGMQPPKGQSPIVGRPWLSFARSHAKFAKFAVWLPILVILAW